MKVTRFCATRPCWTHARDRRVNEARVSLVPVYNWFTVGPGAAEPA
jgi:hypothetical protein